MLIVVTPEIFIFSYICAYAQYLENKYINTDNLSRGLFSSVVDSGSVKGSFYRGNISTVILQGESSDYTCVVVTTGTDVVSRSICFKGISKKTMTPVYSTCWKEDHLSHKMDIYSSGVIRYSTELFEFLYSADGKRVKSG